MSDALDALAPPSTQPSAPAPAAPSPVAPVAPPSSATAPPQAAPAAAAPTPAAVAPTAPEGLTLQQLATSLGYESVDEYKADLAFARRARVEHERRQQLERQNDPAYQQAGRRADATHQLLSETYGDRVANALRALPELTDALHQQRADAAHQELTSQLRDLGFSVDETPDGQKLLDKIEDQLTDRLNGNPRLLKLYHGTPADRRACISEMLGDHEQIVNHALLKQNATALREFASRAQSQPRAGRGVSATPRVRQETPTATDPMQRRREGNAILSRQLDDIHSHFA